MLRQNKKEVITNMDSNYNFYGVPFGMGRLFDRNRDLSDYYYSLPDETQRAILREDIRSEKDFYDCVERLKMKE